MRLYNGTSSSINLPLNNGQRLIVGPKSVSGQFLPSVEFLMLIVSAYSRNDLALIMSGPTEIQMCSSVSTIPGYIAQSVEEAVERFNPVKPETVTVQEEPSSESKLEEKVITNEDVPVVVEEDKSGDVSEESDSQTTKKSRKSNK